MLNLQKWTTKQQQMGLSKKITIKPKQINTEPPPPPYVVIAHLGYHIIKYMKEKRMKKGKKLVKK